MTLTAVVSEAVRALGAHRLRATLSGAGLVCGIAAVIAALAVAEGARRQAVNEAAALGVDNVFIRAHAPAPGRPMAPRFTPDDLVRLERDLPRTHVAAARLMRATLESGGRIIEAQLAGVTPGWNQVTAAQVAEGRWITADDHARQSRVMVLAASLAASLGARTGSEVRWTGRWYRVAGVLAPSRTAENRAVAFVPLTTADDRLAVDDDARGAQEIAIRAGSGEGAEAAARVAARTLAAGGHDSAAYAIVIPHALLRAKLESQRMFDWVLFGVGAIALAISGIGIMNIMLASVAERTSEIGVRRAAGARRHDVLWQFAAESAVLCVAGGLAGVPLGAVLAAAIAAAAGWPIAVAPSSVAVAVALALGTGMLFGTYPARRAAMLDPVEALRG